jgi:glucarate dehydratase
MFQYSDGEIPVPTSPGLGVTLDRDKVAEYSELFEELGGYPYDRDPGRPGWYSTAPNSNYATPKEEGSHGRSP